MPKKETYKARTRKLETVKFAFQKGYKWPGSTGGLMGGNEMSLKLEVLRECLESARNQVVEATTDAVLAELIAMESERLRDSEESQSRRWNGTFKAHQLKVIALAFRRAKILEERN